jgi:sugar transferase (PEP-CTERM/EpsH1 system associated)
VHLACFADEPVDSSIETGLRQYCRRVAIIPLQGRMRWVHAGLSFALAKSASVGAFTSLAMRRLVRDWSRTTGFHAALGSSSSVVSYLQLPELHCTPVVVDLIDVDSQKWLDYADASRGLRAWFYRAEGRRLRGLERELPAWARAVAVVSEAEAELCRQFSHDGEIVGISNGVDLEYFQPQPPSDSSICVFVGAFDYRPNVLGACWFCREVWPRIIERRPEAQLHLVGRRPVPAIQRLGQLAGVRVVGQVPDVRPYIREARFAIAPLQIARGIQNKVLEALAMARAVVATPAALTGLTVRPNAHVLAAEGPDEWTEAVLRLFADTGLCGRLGSAGRRFVEANHDWSRCLEPFGRLLKLTGEPQDSNRRSAGHELVTSAAANYTDGPA